jgi:transposase
MNRVLPIMATVQLPNLTEERAYFDRCKADGKTSMEAMRARRRLSNIVYKAMVGVAIAHAAAGARTGPGQTCRVVHRLNRVRTVSSTP